MNIEEERKEAARLKASGLTTGQIADRMGLSRHAARRRLRYSDPAIEAAMDAVGTGMVPSTVWVKTGTHSVMLRPEVDTTSVAEAMRDALDGMSAIEPVEPPNHTESDLLTCYTLADVHMGMMAWGKETGEDYDTHIASDRVKKWISHCVSQAPASDEALILDVGDLTHADDQKNMTPGSGHILDVDTRHFRTVDVTIKTIAAAIEIALTKHSTVRIRIMRGNHDCNTYIAIMFALAERYRNEPRVDVIKDPMDFFVHVWGQVMIGAHHGDKAKAQSLVLHMADRFADLWGQTRWRFLFTGHLHNHKSQDIGGVTWEQLRAITAKDAYAAGYPFSARSEMQAITYHKDRGEVSRVRVSNWME